MTINLLKHFLQKKEVFYPVGLTVQTGEHPLEIVGIKRTKKETILVALEKVDDGIDAAQASEYMRFENEGPHRFTNRTIMKRHSEPRDQHGLHHLRKIIIDYVEKPMTLAIGEDFPDKIYFEATDTHEKQWAQIHRVSLIDIYESLEKDLSDPKMLEHGSPEQLANMKRELEKNFESICPRGMHLPVIEYECEEDITLQFYHSAYLDAKPSSGGVSAFGFIKASEKQLGKWGHPIKVCVIQHAVPKDTEAIDVELFSFSRMMK